MSNTTNTEAWAGRYTFTIVDETEEHTVKVSKSYPSGRRASDIDDDLTDAASVKLAQKLGVDPEELELVDSEVWSV